MNAMLEVCEEETLGFDCDDDRREGLLSERRALAKLRQLSGRERTSQHSRHSRRPSPTRSSGAHRRRNKRHGL